MIFLFLANTSNDNYPVGVKWRPLFLALWRYNYKARPTWYWNIIQQINEERIHITCAYLI